MDGAIGFDGLITGNIEEGGGTGVTPHVTATASVNDQTGVPGVTVVRTGPDAAPNFDFNFVNLKGADGAPGAQGPQGLTGATGPAGAQGPRGFTGATGATGPAGADGYSPAVSVTDIPGGHRVTITDENHPLGQNFDVMNGVDGTDGEDGSPGPEGPQGPAGVGVPTGGTAGQYLRKVGPGDYLTEWATPAAAEISLDVTNCQIVTSTDLQGSVEELDAELVSVNSSLTQFDLLNFTQVIYSDTTTTTYTNVKTGTFNLEHKSKLLANVFGCVKTSANTVSLVFLVDNTTVVSAQTNSNSFIGINNSKIVTLDAGQHSYEIRLIAQNGATATLKEYTAHGVNCVVVPDFS